MKKDDENSKLMAGLCYVPFGLINIIAILYILLAKKGGPYAKYHALQGLALQLVILVFSMVFMFAFMFPAMQNMALTQDQFVQSANNSTVHSAQSAQFIKNTLAYIGPIFIYSFGIFFVELALAVSVALGKDIRFPMVRGLLERLV